MTGIGTGGTGPYASTPAGRAWAALRLTPGLKYLYSSQLKVTLLVNWCNIEKAQLLDAAMAILFMPLVTPPRCRTPIYLASSPQRSTMLEPKR